MRHQVIVAAGVIVSGLTGCSATVAAPAVVVAAPVGYQGVVKPVAAKKQVIHSANAQLCLDVQGDNASQHADIRLSPCHGKENQRWDFGPGTAGAVQVGGIGGLCLSVMSAPAKGGSMAELLTCSGIPAQELRFYADGRIQELAGQRCLTPAAPQNRAPVVLAPCDAANPLQVWTLADHP